MQKITEMAKYQLTLDKRTTIGRSIFNFLEDLDFVEENTIEVDERNSFCRSLVSFLQENNAIKTNQKNQIAKAITERFMKNRKRKGKLTETELAVLNSQINASYHLSKI